MQYNETAYEIRYENQSLFYDIICGLDIFLVRLDMRLDILLFFVHALIVKNLGTEA